MWCDANAKMVTPATDLCMSSNVKTAPEKSWECGLEMAFMPMDATCLWCIKASWSEGDSYTEMFDNADCQTAYNTLNENWGNAQLFAMNKRVVSSAVE